MEQLIDRLGTGLYPQLFSYAAIEHGATNTGTASSLCINLEVGLNNDEWSIYTINLKNSFDPFRLLVVHD